jgi:hypothetical protein
MIVPPDLIFNMKVKRLHNEDTEGMIDVLSDVCDQYWSRYCAFQMERSDMKRRIQSWYCMLGYRAVLIKYGWWNSEARIPQNWAQTEAYKNAQNTK